MMKERGRKAVFIDRDGVIVEECNYVYRPEELRFIDGSVCALRRLTRSPYSIIIVTNQSGIARGYFTEEEYHIFTEHMLSILKKEDVHIDAVYYCPHHPVEGVSPAYRIDCDCRKPKTGMLERAVREHGIDLESSWLIGDKTSDIKAGKDASCRTIMVRTGYGGSDRTCEVGPDYVVDNLSDAVDLILSAEGLRIAQT